MKWIKAISWKYPFPVHFNSFVSSALLLLVSMELVVVHTFATFGLLRLTERSESKSDAEYAASQATEKLEKNIM